MAALTGSLGTPVVATSALTGQGLEALEPWLGAGQTVAAVGPSGVGKSTLLNRLRGEEVAETGAVRSTDHRGRHTTTRRELVELPSGAFLLDTPGLREFGLWSGETLDSTFEEIGDLSGRCRFRDCTHTVEPGCAVREALDEGNLDEGRYDGYQKLASELRYNALRDELGARGAERKRWKAIHKITRTMGR